MNIAKTFVITVLLALLAISAWGQTATPQPVITPAPVATDSTSVSAVLTDPANIPIWTLLGAFLANAKTDWKFTGPITHREYTLSPATQISLAGGAVGTILFLRTKYPRLNKVVGVAAGIAAAYLAGRALANTYTHDSSIVAGSPMGSPAAHLAVRWGR